VTLARSIAPNDIVVEIDDEEALMLVHRLAGER
jgi:hypothetical protein